MGGKRNGDPPHHRKTPRAQHNPSTPDGAQEGDHQGDAPTRPRPRDWGRPPEVSAGRRAG